MNCIFMCAVYLQRDAKCQSPAQQAARAIRRLQVRSSPDVHEVVLPLLRGDRRLRERRRAREGGRRAGHHGSLEAVLGHLAHVVHALHDPRLLAVVRLRVVEDEVDVGAQLGGRVVLAALELLAHGAQVHRPLDDVEVPAPCEEAVRGA
jgi:hypothetical protein